MNILPSRIYSSAHSFSTGRVEQLYSFVLTIAKSTTSECLYKRFICTTHVSVCWRWFTFPSQALALLGTWCLPSLLDVYGVDVYRYTRVQAVGNTHARACARCSTHFQLLYTRRYIYIVLSAAYAFSLPPPLPVKRPSLLKFLVSGLPWIFPTGTGIFKPTFCVLRVLTWWDRWCNRPLKRPPENCEMVATPIIIDTTI